MNEYNKRFWIIIGMSLAILALIAYIDIGGLILVGNEYTLGNYNPEYWPHFQNIVYFLILIIPIMYYLFTKDKSESLSIGISSYVLWRFGVSDVLYFWLQGKPIVDSLPWLFKHAPINIPAKFLGLSTVTPLSLIISIILGGILTWAIVRFLKEKF